MPLQGGGQEQLAAGTGEEQPAEPSEARGDADARNTTPEVRKAAQ